MLEGQRWWDLAEVGAHGKCWCHWRCALWGLPCLLFSFTSQLWNSHFCHDVPPWSKSSMANKAYTKCSKTGPKQTFCVCVNCLKYFINNNKSLPNRSKMENIKRLTKIYFIKQLNLLSTKLNLSYLKCNV